jgi:hypothetical protein
MPTDGRTLILVLGVYLFCAAVAAQADRQCIEAASLWIPNETSLEKTVMKWNGSIKYGIVSRYNDSDTATPIRNILQTIAHDSGLQLEERDGVVDLMIAVVPDLSTDAARARQFFEGYLQHAAVKKGLRGHFEIDAGGWERQYRSAIPPCAGAGFSIRGALERAFILIQQGEPSSCSEVGLAELFGLINIRKYYVDHAREVPAHLIAPAFRALYSDKIKAGMSEAGAKKVLGEVCK